MEQKKSSFHIRDLICEDLFFDGIDASTKEEAILNLTKLISTKVNLPKKFFDLVLEREEFASTELKNMVAIPHPNKAITESTFIAIGILKKPIVWLNGTDPVSWDKK